MKKIVYNAEKHLSKLTSGEPTCMEEAHVYNVYDIVGILLLYFVAAVLNVDFICRITDFWSAIAIRIVGIFFILILASSFSAHNVLLHLTTQEKLLQV